MPITIHWSHGCPKDPTEDEARAAEAAYRVLGDNDPLAASIAFGEQVEQFDGDEDQMTGLAALWRDAQKAADLAATQGWRDPDGGSVYLSAW